MTPTPFNLSRGYVHAYEQDGKCVRLRQENDKFIVEYSDDFPRPVQQFITLPDALRVFQWFTKSIKHGYL